MLNSQLLAYKPPLQVPPAVPTTAGVSNELALRHVPEVDPRWDDVAGPPGRRGDQVLLDGGVPAASTAGCCMPRSCHCCNLACACRLGPVCSCVCVSVVVGALVGRLVGWAGDWQAQACPPPCPTYAPALWPHAPTKQPQSQRRARRTAPPTSAPLAPEIRPSAFAPHCFHSIVASPPPVPLPRPTRRRPAGGWLHDDASRGPSQGGPLVGQVLRGRARRQAGKWAGHAGLAGL